ncbi:serine hydrolase FSH [Ophiocordyceps camponoti-floridani]|uniref:Serine hydrolase FSH n=1 Tax=Ophiocordyceps camponoti-floridani TaxID=2030778 RepID=A0A8H4Q8D5_9HYPO|nr:serine hydrolase FSH [Ophiocordyceps camponoti-floridani]
MRFLCLHGRGTDADIFKSQTARLREALGPEHEYVFVNGNVRARARAGLAADTTYGPQGRGFWPLDDADEERTRRVYHDMIAFIASRGPFDGLMAFSEGASVAATLLAELARPDSDEPIATFRCAVFFCGLPPLDLQLRKSGRAVRMLDPAVDGVAVRLPTAHIWSGAGQVLPDAGRHLAALCDPDTREELIHDLGHQVPGSRSEQGLRQTVRVIERTLERAKSCSS